jgi:hypothetical protein
MNEVAARVVAATDDGVAVVVVRDPQGKPKCK